MRRRYSVSLSGRDSKPHRQSASFQKLLQPLEITLQEDQKVMDHRIRDKFRGCLVGALVGDCIGTLFECDYSVSHKILADLYTSLTNLSEDEKLMDLHGIDNSTIEPKLAQELLEKKKQIHRASVVPMIVNERSSPTTSPNAPPKRHSSFETRRSSFSRPIEKFSDDTVMTHSVVRSLIKMNGFDLKDLAKQLTEDYFLNLTRKFGAFTRDVFTQIRDSGYSDPQGPSKKYSGYIGSLGNEGAARTAPIALYGWNTDQSLVIDMAAKLTRITNFHKSAVNGAICQAIAVHTAFNWDLPKDQEVSSISRQLFKRSTPSPVPSPSFPRKSLKNQENIPMNRRNSKHFNAKEFCAQILERLSLAEARTTSIFENFKSFMQPNRDSLKLGEFSYSDKLKIIIEFLERPEPPSRSEVVEKLGNSVKAIESVPTALYSFLLSVSSDKFPEIPVLIKSPVLRSIFYAISLGGDSDTIASMAGSIAGAYWGFELIPNEILRVCEGSRDTIKLADDLYNSMK